MNLAAKLLIAQPKSLCRCVRVCPLANSRGPLRTWSAAQNRMPCGCAGCGSHTGCDHPDAAVLLFARMLIGLAIGADSAIATAYIAE